MLKKNVKSCKCLGEASPPAGVEANTRRSCCHATVAFLVMFCFQHFHLMCDDHIESTLAPLLGRNRAHTVRFCRKERRLCSSTFIS